MRIGSGGFCACLAAAVAAADVVVAVVAAVVAAVAAAVVAVAAALADEGKEQFDCQGQYLPHHQQSQQLCSNEKCSKDEIGRNDCFII